MRRDLCGLPCPAGFARLASADGTDRVFWFHRYLDVQRSQHGCNGFKTWLGARAQGLIKEVIEFRHGQTVD